MSLIRADALHLPLASGTVQCCVTSPPYWGLRDYGVSGQLGLEPTPEAYVASMVAVFRQIRRVLRDDGTLWLNLGDSYAAGKPRLAEDCEAGGQRWTNRQSALRAPELKPKDLVGIPWRVAFALQADGWYLRSDVIWSKPNPMPESVTDRPTKAHEYVFLLTKAERYYWDAEAVKEPAAPSSWAREGLKRGGAKTIGGGNRNDGDDLRHTVFSPSAGRNIRSVWSIATQPYTGAHFATMPEALAERCILAGSRPGDLVLDPFLGSGTVARCAISLGRRAVGTDLNPAYLKLARERTQVTRGLPLEMGA